MSRPWTEKEVKILKENYYELGGDVRYMLGRTRASVKTKARKLGLRSHHHLTNEQKQYIKDNIHKTRQEIANDLNIPVKKVNSYVWNTNLSPAPWKYFTEEENNYIRKHYTIRSYKEMGKVLGRSEDSIKHHTRDVLKLFRTPQQAKQIQDAWSKNTRFKKGSTPPNTKHDGAISVRKDTTGASYLHIRVAKGVWELLHRKIWEQHYGPIPKGYNIIFKNGDQGNVSIDNLEMVSNKDLMLKNSVQRYPEDLRRLIQASGALNRQINKILNNEEQK